MAKKSKYQVNRVHLNAAMEEFFSRGGRIKKINNNTPSNPGTRHIEWEDDLFTDYSAHEVSCSIPMRSGFKLDD